MATDSLSRGSGFCVGNGELASNVHVIAGAARGYAKLVGENTKYDIEGIAALSPEADLVVVKISGGCSQALALGNSDAVQVGDSVYAVGNPQGLEGTFSQGIVSSVRELGSNKLLQITAPISPGSSGGPVLNKKGEVIGVSVATFRGGQNLNFAVPSIYLKELLSKAGPLMPLAQAKAQKSFKACRMSAAALSPPLANRSTFCGSYTRSVFGSTGNATPLNIEDKMLGPIAPCRGNPDGDFGCGSSVPFIDNDKHPSWFYLKQSINAPKLK
jgi:Trypsin-like peptidase domain